MDVDISEIRKKHLLNCNEQELRMRCSYDEHYIQRLESEHIKYSKRIKELERKIKELEDKIQYSRDLYESTRDYDGEFD